MQGKRRGGSEPVKGLRQRRLHKAFLRYHEPENWPVLRDVLREMRRADLVGPRPDQLVPTHQSAGTNGDAAASRSVRLGATVHDEGGADQESRRILIRS